MRASYLVLAILSLTLWASCSSDSTSPASSFSGSPDAKASEDAKSGGIYKGVIAGSSGYFAVVLQSGLTHIKVTMDGESRTLTTTGLASWVSGEPIKNVVFASGDWQATFSVGAAGNTPSISFSIPGHTDPRVALLKEYSNGQVRLYEGSYTGTSSGTWNFLTQGPALTGVSRSQDGNSSLTFYGFVNENSLTLDVVEGTGTFSGDNVSGTWSLSGSADSGTWTGKRVM
ncbi:MAG: hypothetical protein JNN04_12150 [Cyclobacteriaceae bacterium]|nr:hypothetical protein [Cyclobacteriaceae bacterium]